LYFAATPFNSSRQTVLDRRIDFRGKPSSVAQRSRAA
jgi:hypothetical protein